MATSNQGVGRTFPEGGVDNQVPIIDTTSADSSDDIKYVDLADAVLEALGEIDAAALLAAGAGYAQSVTQNTVLTVPGGQIFSVTTAAITVTLPSVTLCNSVLYPPLRTVQIKNPSASGTITVMAPTGGSVAGGGSTTVAPGAFKAFAAKPGTNAFEQVS